MGATPPLHDTAHRALRQVQVQLRLTSGGGCRVQTRAILPFELPWLVLCRSHLVLHQVPPSLLQLSQALRCLCLLCCNAPLPPRCEGRPVARRR